MSEKWSLITNWGIKFSGGIFHDLPCVFRLNSFQVNKKTSKQDEKDVGFTVIRVESSVSSEDAEEHQVNADNDAVEEDRNAAVTLGDNNQNEKEEEAQKEETTSEATEVSTTTEDEADTLVTTTQATSQQTTTDEDIRYIVFNIYLLLNSLCPFILVGLIRSSI